MRCSRLQSSHSTQSRSEHRELHKISIMKINALHKYFNFLKAVKLVPLISSPGGASVAQI